MKFRSEIQLNSEKIADPMGVISELLRQNRRSLATDQVPRAIDYDRSGQEGFDRKMAVKKDLHRNAVKA